MRAPPVRSYIHRAEPRARAILGFDHAVPGRTSGSGTAAAAPGAGRCAAGAGARPGPRRPAGLALLQVAQAAVDELRGLRRRARGEVVALDQRGAQPAGGGVERDPAPVMPPPTTSTSNCSSARPPQHRRPVETSAIAVMYETDHARGRSRWTARPAPAGGTVLAEPRRRDEASPRCDDHLRPPPSDVPRRGRPRASSPGSSTSATAAGCACKFCTRSRRCSS